MFKRVNPKIEFPEMEREILERWNKTGLIKKYLLKNNLANKNFSFLDGPITANNPMGVHHAWGRTYKDLWQRFKNMQGFKQRFQNGFDNQGLWVEVEVEKSLGFKSKRDIESFGIDKFVEKCKEHTLKFAQIQTKQSQRLGYFMDWDNSYYTMSEENNYTIWHFLAKCYQKDLLYKGRDSVPWCPRCGTAISQHEILTEEYHELTHDSVYLKLPIVERKNEFFLVWTTTPWTIPSNVALAVNPEFIYASFKNKKTGEILIFLKEKMNEVFEEKDDWEQVGEYQGIDLAGLHYRSVFDNLPSVARAKNESPDKFHIVFTDCDNVNSTEGTGIVHIAPGAGSEDFQMGKRENLSVIASIDESANYLEGFGDLSGKNAKTNPELIFDMLKTIENSLFLFKIKPYIHRYPVCWRCKTELVWRVVSEWYISMDPIRDQIKNVAKNLTWIPKWGLELELDWLSHMQDWLISKKRYWGLALPIWECEKCGHFDVIGSAEELKMRAISGWDQFEGHTPHRPWIDNVLIECPKCQNHARRIPDVGNPWLDAGIVPFSTLHYLDDKKYWEEWFPADFVTECFPGQFKNWFYSLLAMSTVLENKNPFKTLLGHSLVRDEKGEEMHKSKGNAIDFSEAAEKMGVDVMRWMYVTQNPEINLNFGYHVADETRRRFHLILWNIYNFFMTYAFLDRIKKEDLEINEVKSLNILDQWVVSKFNRLVQKVTDSLEQYNAYEASRAIEDFVVNDVSTWYIRRCRDRVGSTVDNQTDKVQFYQTAYQVLVSLAKILGPFTPFLAEEIYQNLTGGKSVHLSSWPKSQESLIRKEVEGEMELVRNIVEMGHAARKKESIKVRQPLQAITVKINRGELGDEYLKLIKEELNIKTVQWKKVSKLEMEIELDTKITPQLRDEGQARELVRKIQTARRGLEYGLDDLIEVSLPSWPIEFEDYLKKETLASTITKGQFQIKKAS